MIEDSENPEIVISVGGDGTLLQHFSIAPHVIKSGICWSSYRSFRFYVNCMKIMNEKLIIEINNSEFQLIQFHCSKLL